MTSSHEDIEDNRANFEMDESDENNDVLDDNIAHLANDIRIDIANDIEDEHDGIAHDMSDHVSTVAGDPLQDIASEEEDERSFNALRYAFIKM